MPTQSRADRLHAILAKVAPAAAAQHAEHGTWPHTGPDSGYHKDTGEPSRHAGAPYVIEELPTGKRRLRVTGEDGDVIAGVGATLDDAIAAVEQKLGLSAAKE